jgi:hypothetical protein
MIPTKSIMVLTAIATALVCFGIHSIYMGFVDRAHETALKNQATNLNTQCEAAKAVTEEVSNELQNTLALRDNALAAARRMLNKHCSAPVVVNTSAGHDDKTEAGKLRLQNGESIIADGNELLDIAADAEADRSRLIACQIFVEKNRGARLNK